MNERNLRASHLIFYNVPESKSTHFEKRITHDKEEINKIINIISLDTN